MKFASFRVAGKEYVVVPKREYERLTAAKDGVSKPRRGKRRISAAAMDARDAAELKRRLADTQDSEIPFAQVRKELGV